MKKFTLLLTLAGVFGLSQLAVAQNSGGGCVPDMSFVGFGIFPPPDTSDVLFSDPTLGIQQFGCSGEFYTYDLTAVIPDSLDAEPFIGVPLVVPLESVQVLSAEGEDVDGNVAMGFTQLGWTLENNLACSKPDCFFEPTVEGGLTYECGRISGMIPEITEVTDYRIIYEIEGIAFVFGMNVPVTLNYPDNDNFPGFYYLRAYPAGQGPCLVGVEDLLAEQLSVSQNVPNPFSAKTEITLNSVVADTYEFKVYNLVGKLEFTRTIEAIAGENLIEFDAKNLGSGVYMYSLGNEKGLITRKMMINK